MILSVGAGARVIVISLSFTVLPWRLLGHEAYHYATIGQLINELGNRRPAKSESDWILFSSPHEFNDILAECIFYPKSIEHASIWFEDFWVNAKFFIRR